MMLARAGSTLRCAHTWMLNANAEQPSPVNTTAKSACPVTLPRPSSATSGTENAAIASSSTQVSDTTSNRFAHAPTCTNQIPNETAVTSVIASPKPSVGCAPVRRNNPMTASTTDTTTDEFGRRRYTTAATSGVNTAKRPVMKAEFEVVVCWRPRAPAPERTRGGARSTRPAVRDRQAPVLAEGLG